MTFRPLFDLSQAFVAVLLAVLAALLLLGLVGLVIWRGVDELRFLRRQRLIRRYRPLVDALLASVPEPDTIPRLVATPGRHHHLLGDLLLGALRLTTGDVIPRLREAAQALGLLARWRSGLTDRRWWVRAEAVRALGLVRDPASVYRLLEALNEPHEEVRAAAVDALGRIGDPRCAPALLAQLQDESRHQRARLIEAIRCLGPTIMPVLREHAHQLTSNTAMMVDIVGIVGGTTAIDSLLEWTDSPEPALRAAALRAIGSIGLDDRSYFSALRHLEDADPDVRGMAARALGRVGRQDAVPYLARHLDDEWLVAAHCATGLRRLGTPGAAALQVRLATPGQGADLARQMLWELNVQKAAA
jgi:HEAT repeat protein